MYTAIQNYCDSLIRNFSTISDERKNVLNKIAAYIHVQVKNNKPVNLIYICTHNSRRSHFGQVWAAVAADFYDVKNVCTFSGGTEVTAFNQNAIHTLEAAGFHIEQADAGVNPLYNVYYSDADFIRCFSKVYSDSENPSGTFAAIMTCTDADVKCPIINGAAIKIATPYEDPKIFDGTEMQDEQYSERCRQIALECLYVFSRVR